MSSSEPVHASANTPFTIEIPSNPTTGYRWQVAALPGSVEVLDSSFRAKPEARPGDGGTAVFRLVATEPGDYAVELVLGRAWESAPVERRTVLVQVR